MLLPLPGLKPQIGFYLLFDPLWSAKVWGAIGGFNIRLGLQQKNVEIAVVFPRPDISELKLKL